MQGLEHANDDMTPTPTTNGAPLTHQPQVHMDEAWVRQPAKPRWSYRTGWIGWRLRLLVLATLAGCLGLLFFIHGVASAPVLRVMMDTDAQGLVTYTPERGQSGTVLAIHDAQGRALPVDAAWLERSARWIVSDAWLARHEAARTAMAQAIRLGPVDWQLQDGRSLRTEPEPLGVKRLGPLFWPITALALALYLVVMVVVLSKPNGRNALFAILALPHVGHLLFVAAEQALGPWATGAFSHQDHVWRSTFDIVSAAGIGHALALHPRKLPWHRTVGLTIWPAALAGTAWVWLHGPMAWWVTQGLVILFAMVAVVQVAISYRAQPHPLALAMLRFGLVGWLVFILMTIALGASSGSTAITTKVVASMGTMIWTVFMATLLLTTPFFARTQPTMREFAMLAAVSTMATALDLLFVAVFALGPFASLSLATFLSLMAYTGVRQWILNQMLRTNVLTTERVFEMLYRIARDKERHPQSLAQRLTELLQELYAPLEITRVAESFDNAHVVGGGSALVVPVPAALGGEASGSIVLRYAHRGKRLFTTEDAHLTDRALDQLTRAVAFDQAVERGRREERERIAQDLHDDIGARLLTLMYKASDRDSEDYIRHTIQELKTLTRGLAAQEHRLSDSVGEWKADIAHRLAAAHAVLDWRFHQDKDILLNVVQWSAITRILRELVTNTMAHGHASQVLIEGNLAQGQLTLRVADDGQGVQPDLWSHGLGLGGVRKRVSQLRGSVHWREVAPRGIECLVQVPLDGPSAKNAHASDRVAPSPAEGHGQAEPPSV